MREEFFGSSSLLMNSTSRLLWDFVVGKWMKHEQDDFFYEQDETTQLTIENNDLDSFDLSVSVKLSRETPKPHHDIFRNNKLDLQTSGLVWEKSGKSHF